MKARFKKDGASYSISIPAVFDILPDGSLKTRAIITATNQFGTDMSAGLFRQHYENPNDKKVTIITPLIPYELFEQTEDEKECAILSIDYYMGVSNYDVIKNTGSRTFVVTEKLRIQGGRKANNDTGGMFNNDEGINEILNYQGLKHVKKAKKDVKYTGDQATEIKLLDGCKFKMFKFVKIVTPDKKNFF